MTERKRSLEDRPPPAITYKPTWLEVQAVRLLGTQALHEADGLRRATLAYLCDDDRRLLWSDTKAFYHDAVRRARGRSDCPRELYLKPAVARLETTKPENERKRP